MLPLASPSRPPSSKALDDEVFARIRGIQIRTRRLVTEAMAGEYESAFKGRGVEFEQVREYQSGDDVRAIDWNVTARSGVPHVKQYREERELTVLLLVDLSASGSFGSAEKTKNEIAAEVAAVLAYTAIRSNDRVGLILFTDSIEHYIPAQKGRAHVWRVIREILTFEPRGRGTDIAGALDALSRMTPRRGVVFLLSDFLLEQADTRIFEDRLRVAARRHDVTALVITDPREASLSPIGLIRLRDAESGDAITVDARDPAVRRALEELTREETRRRSELFRSAGVGEVRITTGEPYVDALVRFFRQREARR